MVGAWGRSDFGISDYFPEFYDYIDRVCNYLGDFYNYMDLHGRGFFRFQLFSRSLQLY